MITAIPQELAEEIISFYAGALFEGLFFGLQGMGLPQQIVFPQ